MFLGLVMQMFEGLQISIDINMIARIQLGIKATTTDMITDK